jgi:hypothetical protein
MMGENEMADNNTVEMVIEKRKKTAKWRKMAKNGELAGVKRR